MKKLNTLIALEKEFLQRSQELKNSYKAKTEKYILQSSETISQLESEIRQKHEIITKRLETIDSSAKDTNIGMNTTIDKTQITSLIFEYINQ